MCEETEFIEVQLAICGEKGSHRATRLLRALRQPVADNRLVASSSPPSPRWRLITAWLEVRVLSGPPRSLAQTEISRFFMKSPKLAGIPVRILSLQCVDGISGAVSAPLSLPRKIAFPGSGNRCWWNAGQQLLGIPITLRRRSRMGSAAVLRYRYSAIVTALTSV